MAYYSPYVITVTRNNDLLEPQKIIITNTLGTLFHARMMLEYIIYI